MGFYFSIRLPGPFGFAVPLRGQRVAVCEKVNNWGWTLSNAQRDPEWDEVVKWAKAEILDCLESDRPVQRCGKLADIAIIYVWEELGWKDKPRGVNT